MHSSLGPWEKGEVFNVSFWKSIFIAEGTEQDKGRRQAEKERRRKEQREEHHICMVAHHTHSILLTSLMPTHHWQPVAACACPGFHSLHHWIHFRDVLILFPEEAPFFYLFSLYSVKPLGSQHICINLSDHNMSVLTLRTRDSSDKIPYSLSPRNP